MDTQAPRLIFDFDRYPYLTRELPGVGGVLRHESRDFQVEEIPAFEPEGEGDHLLLHLEKLDMNTRHLVEFLQASLGLDEHAVGWAGLKDRRALTRQWISVPASVEPQLAGLAWPEGVRLLATVRHPRKLQEGALAGNRFRILLREVTGTAEQARTVLEALARRGVPNLYGPQRFGREGDNAERGLRLLRAGRARSKRWLDKLMVNALQSLIFNEWATVRIERGLYDTVIHGDIAVKHVSGGKFLVGDPEAEAPRAAALEISATGPLFGKKYHEAAFEARAIEDEVLAGFGLTREDFKPLPGTRRPIRFPLTEWAVEEAPEGLWVSFVLPAGAYATAVLREVMKREIEESEAPQEREA